jgi:hypothetical protein
MVQKIHWKDKVTNLVKKVIDYMGPEGWLPFSQKPVILT